MQQFVTQIKLITQNHDESREQFVERVNTMLQQLPCDAQGPPHFPIPLLDAGKNLLSYSIVTSHPVLYRQDKMATNKRKKK